MKTSSSILALSVVSLLGASCSKKNSVASGEASRYAGSYVATDTVYSGLPGSPPDDTDHRSYIFTIEKTGDNAIKLTNFLNTNCPYTGLVSSTLLTLQDTGSVSCSLTNFSCTFDGTTLLYSGEQYPGGIAVKYRGKAVKQ